MEGCPLQAMYIFFKITITINICNNKKYIKFILFKRENNISNISDSELEDIEFEEYEDESIHNEEISNEEFDENFDIDADINYL